MTPPAERPTTTAGGRRRFVAALTVYVLWITSLVALAIWSAEPPDPEAGANPGAIEGDPE